MLTETICHSDTMRKPNNMTVIPISHVLFKDIAKVVGNDPEMVGKVLASQYWGRRKEKDPRRDIERIITRKVIAKIEEMEGMPKGYLLERHRNGKMNQEARRAIFRNIAMLVVVRKFGYAQCHILHGMGMHHTSYNHAVEVIADLHFSSCEWRAKIQKVESTFAVKIT